MTVNHTPLSPRVFSAEWFRRIEQVDTPTICNALELAGGTRDATGFTYGTPIAAPAPLPAIAGYARTLRFRAAVPSPLGPDESRAMKLAYYRYISQKDAEPVIVMMEDIDHTPGLGSNWGEVNSNLHKALGVKGVVTNGSVRDIDMLAAGFPIIAGSIGPSHAHAHIVDFDVPVTVLGMQVRPDDIVHADRHGAVVISKELAPELVRCIDLTFAKERPLLEAAKRPGFSIEDIARAFEEASDIH